MHLRLLLTAWIVTACVYVSGCASMLYVRGKPVQGLDTTITRLEEVAQTDKAYVTATKTTDFRAYYGFGPILLQFTPLGIMGPLFGYPQKSYAFTGTVNIHTDPPEAGSRIPASTSFRIEGQKGSSKVVLDFTKGVEDALKTTGRTIEYSPEFIEVIVTCADTACQVTSRPNAIFSDGLVRLESREVVNQARLQEIGEAEAAAKRKKQQEEAEAAAKKKQQEDEAARINSGPGTPSYLDEKNGFRDAHFAMQRVAIPGNWRLQKQDAIEKTESYSRQDDALRIGDAAITSVEYLFFKAQLYAVMIVADGDANAAAVHEYFSQAFGKPGPDWDMMASVTTEHLKGQMPEASRLKNLWIWSAQKVTLREWEGYGRSAFLMEDRNLKGEQSSFAEAKAPEKKQAEENRKRERLHEMERRGDF